MKLLDGKLVAGMRYDDLRAEVLSFSKTPVLKIILVGDNPASLSYVKSKKNAAKKVGIDSDIIRLIPEETSTESLFSLIESLNNDESVNGILVQLPLPSHIDEDKVIAAVSPVKDVDGFHALNVGKMFLGEKFEDLKPCTPSGILDMLNFYEIDVVGKDVVVVGRSNIVGKPVALMLINRGATVTVCNSKTRDLKFHTSNRGADGKLYGDVDFEEVAKKASFITPVPGGCGPMTVASLMGNTVKAFKLQNNILDRMRREL